MSRHSRNTTFYTFTSSTAKNMTPVLKRLPSQVQETRPTGRKRTGVERQGRAGGEYKRKERQGFEKGLKEMTEPKEEVHRSDHTLVHCVCPWGIITIVWVWLQLLAMLLSSSSETLHSIFLYLLHILSHVSFITELKTTFMGIPR